jgi:galactose mutarotase-like enzyme
LTGFELIELRSDGGALEATFVPEAGMIGWSLRHWGEELLAHPVSLEEYVSGGHVTALPLLHPWANRLSSPAYDIAGRHVALDLAAANVHTDPAGLPIHGLVAGCRGWEVLESGRTRLRAQLDFAAHPELMSGFPFAHVLELTAEVADTGLSIATRLVPTGDRPVPVAFGFHPYLQLPGVPREEWIVGMSVTRQMELDDRMLPTGRTEAVHIPPGPLGDRTFDDAFDGLGDPPEFVVSGGGRKLAMRFLEGYRFAQIYSPHGGEFICFEPMTAPGDPFNGSRTQLAEPGSEYTARFEIAIAAADA